MSYTKILPAVAVLSTLLVATSNAENPWFCQSYDCPAFTSEDRGSYEIRNYVESNWVATSVMSSSPDANRSDRSAMFRKLFKYITGANERNQKIDMTVPVLTKIETQRDQYRLTMMFYLAVANPPAPTNSDVVLVTRPAGPVFVKSFPSWWWPLSRTYGQKTTELKNNIGDPTLYNDNVYYKAGYNSPYDFFKRKQHEVWVDRV